MKELKVSPRTQSVLRASGVWADLRAACAALVNTDPALIRSMMISAGDCEVGPGVANAIMRFAEEQLLTAEVERRDGRLIVRLHHLEEGGAR